LHRNLVWYLVPLTGLLVGSLWAIPDPRWLAGVGGMVLLLAIWHRVAWNIILGRVVPLLVFLLVIQILFSSYSRHLFLATLQGSATFADWSFSLQALARLALPLILVITFEDQWTRPQTVIQASAFLQPLRWLGLPIRKYQAMLQLSIRLLPVLSREWERFRLMRDLMEQIDGPMRIKLIQRLQRQVILLRAFLNHMFRRAGKLGELLALRAPVLTATRLPTAQFLILLLAWTVTAAGIHLVIPGFLPWGMAILLWFLLMQLSLDPGEVEVT